MGALVAVVFLILREARLQNIEGGEMVPQVLIGKVVGRPARLALVGIFLDLLPLAASRFLLRKNGEKEDTPLPNLSQRRFSSRPQGRKGLGDRVFRADLVPGLHDLSFFIDEEGGADDTEIFFSI